MESLVGVFCDHKKYKVKIRISDVTRHSIAQFSQNISKYLRNQNFILYKERSTFNLLSKS